MPPARPVPPKNGYPIVIIGAGGIVRDAHLPAYRQAGFRVDTLVDRQLDRAQALASEYGVAKVFATVAEAVAQAPREAVYDLALPASQFGEALRRLPVGAHVLIQKPMGETLTAAREILAVCRERHLHAAVNLTS